MRGFIDGSAEKCLLLGSTSEYAEIGAHVVAMDMSLTMMRALWIASDPDRIGIQADWTQMPIGATSINHVLADGSLNAVPFRSALPRMLDGVRRVLRPGGKLIARVFCRPAAAETFDAIKHDLAAKRVDSFHALKWRVAMAAVRGADAADIAVQEIRDTIIERFPDRDELCRATGWSRAEVDTIDVYDGSPAVYNFPTEAMILELLRPRFPKVAAVRCGSYALAERCPLLVAQAAP